MGFLSRSEIDAMGFAKVGDNVRLSRKVSFYNCAGIEIGDHSRIDDYCVISAGAGGITIGRNVHIAVFCSVMGAGAIAVGDFAGLSSRVSIYSSNDDYSGAALTNPTVPVEFTRVSHAPVTIGRHVIIGSGTIILPGVTVEEGAAVGALSLVKRDCSAFGVYIGTPAKRIAARKTDLLALEQKYLDS